MSRQEPIEMSADDFNQIIRQIQTLKLADLKLVSKSLSLAQNGRKADVADRIKRYLQTGRDSKDNIRVMAIGQIVQDALYGRNLPDYDSLYMLLRQQGQQGQQHGDLINGGHALVSNSSQDSLPKSQSNPRRPWLFFKENPFFILKKLVTPNAGYCFKAPESRGTCRVQFTLNDQDSELLKASKYKLFLLCGVHDRNKSSTDALVEFPQPLEIHFNNNMVKDNVKGLKNKPGTARPANLTPYISSANHTNNLELVYAFSKQDYLIFVYLIEEVPPEKLLQKVLANPHIAKQKTLYELQNNDDDDIQEMSTILSLKCPLSFTRFKYPTKSIACKHLPCFDALSFIYLQEQASTWTCPVCSIPVCVKDLAIDDYVMGIMKNTTDEVEAVEIDLEGSWKPIYEDDNNTRNHTPHQKTPAPLKKEESASSQAPVSTSNSPIIISLDTDDEEDEAQPAPQPPVPQLQTLETEAPPCSPPRLQRRPPPHISTDSPSPADSHADNGSVAGMACESASTSYASFITGRDQQEASQQTDMQVDKAQSSSTNKQQRPQHTPIAQEPQAQANTPQSNIQQYQHHLQYNQHSTGSIINNRENVSQVPQRSQQFRFVQVEPQPHQSSHTHHRQHSHQGQGQPPVNQLDQQQQFQRFDPDDELERMEAERQQLLIARKRLQDEQAERENKKLMEEQLQKEISLSSRIQIAKEVAMVARHQHEQQDEAIMMPQAGNNQHHSAALDPIPAPPVHTQRHLSHQVTLPPLRPQTIAYQQTSFNQLGQQAALSLPSAQSDQQSTQAAAQSSNIGSKQFCSPISIFASTNPPTNLINPSLGDFYSRSPKPLVRKPSETESAYEAEKDEMERLKKTIAKASRSASENTSPNIAPAVPAHQRFDKLAATRIPDPPYRDVTDTYNGYPHGHVQSTSLPYEISNPSSRPEDSLAQNQAPSLFSTQSSPAAQAHASSLISEMTSLAAQQGQEHAQNQPQQQTAPIVINNDGQNMQSSPPVPVAPKRAVSNPDTLKSQTAEQSNLRASLMQYQQKNGLNRASTVIVPQIRGNATALDNIQKLSQNIASHVSKSSSSNSWNNEIKAADVLSNGSDTTPVSTASAEQLTVLLTEKCQQSEQAPLPPLPTFKPTIPAVTTASNDSNKSGSTTTIVQQSGQHKSTLVPIPDWSANSLLRPQGAATQFSPSRFGPTENPAGKAQTQISQEKSKELDSTQDPKRVPSLPDKPILTGGVSEINVELDNSSKKEETNPPKAAASNSTSSSSTTSPNGVSRPNLPNVFIPSKRPITTDKKRVSSQQSEQHHAAKRPMMQKQSSSLNMQNTSTSSVIDLTSDPEE